MRASIVVEILNHPDLDQKPETTMAERATEATPFCQYFALTHIHSSPEYKKGVVINEGVEKAHWSATTEGVEKNGAKCSKQNN